MPEPMVLVLEDGFTVFGETVYNSMSVVDGIAGLPTGSATNISPNFSSDVPFKNFTTGATPTTANLVNVPNVSVVPKLNFSVTSDNPALVTPTKIA